VKTKIKKETLKVAANSHPNKVAGAIAGALRDGSNVELQAIGAGAINQAVKAIAVARGYIAPSGDDLLCAPGFIDLEVGGKLKTGIILKLSLSATA